MSEHKENVPKIRFPGFTDAWEQRRLGEAFNQTSEYVNPQAEGIELWSLTVENGLTPKTDRYMRDFLVRKDDKYKVVRPNDIVYNPMNMTLGAIGYNNMSKTVAVSGYYITMESTKIIDGYYIKTWMQGPQAINLYKMSATGSLIEKQRVQYPTFAEIKFTMPEINEQKKIGAFFRDINHLITLHQRKLNNVKSLKAGLLQKMFPKNGEDFPEVRFPGFTDAWEQRRLCEIAEFNPKSMLPDEFEYVDLESVVGTNLIGHRTESKDSAPSRAQRLAQLGDVFYQTVRPYQKNNYLYDLPYDNYVFSTGYAQMRPSIDSYFLLSRLQEELFVKTVLDRSTGTSYPAINSNDLAEIEIKVPIDNDEQVKIGSLFRSLDHLITLHQRKLEHLQEQKKALLQQMFI
ncbi:restriction endonuclease subunit S [Paenibacillus polymyxa]|uniref:restriction endonuclease subunit S n=1 Tax=Paenibacillus polymyxa TaxID=1406 RepID=UPI002024B316|nr:restriction endonuclease subunit S [Paenibacillus polymyxa]URJ37338.1 restriction endonuclease subunit S [Paenibacillus polymyxa]